MPVALVSECKGRLKPGAASRSMEGARELQWYTVTSVLPACLLLTRSRP